MEERSAPPSAHSIPPVQPASRFAVLASVGEVALYLGVSRIAFNAEGQGIAQAVEFAAGYSLSPQVAAQLRDALNQVVLDYEAQYGKIAVGDPLHKTEGLVGQGAPKQ